MFVYIVGGRRQFIVGVRWEIPALFHNDTGSSRVFSLSATAM